jgi:hypothetical protein
MVCTRDSWRVRLGFGRETLKRAHHLLGHHDDGLDGEASVAVIEEILQAGAQKVDDEDVVQALLAEVIDVGDAGWRVRLYCLIEGGTYGIQRGFCTCGTHLAAGERRSCAVPGESAAEGTKGETDKFDSHILVV